MIVNRTLLLSAVLLLTVTARPLHAQDQPDSVRERNQCRLAAQIIGTGHPAPHDAWALQTIRNCGAIGVTAIATGLGAMRTDPYGPDLDQPAGLTLWFRDGQLFQVAMNIAGDPGASLAARLLALRTIVWQIQSVPLGGADWGMAIGATWVFSADKDPALCAKREVWDQRLRRAYVLANVTKEEGSLWHALRRKWASERKGHPISDVAAAGGWRDKQTLLESYQRPDAETIQAVVLNKTRSMGVR